MPITARSIRWRRWFLHLVAFKGVSFCLLAGWTVDAVEVQANELPTGLSQATATEEPVTEEVETENVQPALRETPQENEKSQKPEEDYFELLKMFADTLDQVERNYVNPISRRELMEAAIKGLIKELDPHSNYISPSELDTFKTEVEFEFGGIGIQYSAERGRLQVISPLVGSPAYHGGVLAGDHIILIDGVSTEGITNQEVVRKLKGPVGTKVTITVIHADKHELEEITLTREVIRLDTVMGTRRKADGSWVFTYDADQQIGYIRITAFSRNTARELRLALMQLRTENMAGLILDLRFNPGGLLSSAIEVSDMFVRSGRIVSTEGRNIRERVWNAQDEGTFDGFDMVVLVNNYSASASEIVAGCLQDHQQAIIMGERTWGKGSVQNIIDLENGRSALKLTTASYKRPSGKNIHRFEGSKTDDDWGIRPNDGYKLRLDARETRQLIDHLRAQDLALPSTLTPDQQSDVSDSDGEFVDRQLRNALDYLGDRVARN